MRIHIVGAGLIGTSIALGLTKAGHQISLDDASAENLAVAQDLLGGQGTKSQDADLVVVATPIGAVFTTIESEFALNPKAAFIDIAGLKSEVLHQVENFPELAKRYCGTHPMAGREISGPTGARADLFQGATWILTPTSVTEPDVLDICDQVLRELGAIKVLVGGDAHDKSISAISHLPQIASSLLAQNLLSLKDDEIALAGQGLRDLTRLADSNPKLWSELLLHNSENVKADLERIKSSIELLIAALNKKDQTVISNFFADGNKGKSRIPGKHGGKSRDYAYLPIVIDDKPGQLAAIFDECAKVKANVEDLFIEHSPGQFTGLITLALSQSDAEVLREHLAKQNWRVHEIRATR